MIDSSGDALDTTLPAEDLLFNKPDAAAVLTALTEAASERKQTISATLVYGLNELAPAEWQQLEGAWRRLPGRTKQRIMRRLNESSEALFELNYRELGLRTLHDDCALAREAAIDLLWTDESEETMTELIRLADQDPSPEVRAGAVKALGRFILLGEYGDMPAALAQEAQQIALRLHQDKTRPLELRRRALEALANSSHPQVHDLISKAYADGNHDLKISAIFAMGRTCSAIWREILLAELDSDDNEAVYEAATACGRIQLEDSLPRISELALSEDREIKLSAIWALGEIGGGRAFEILSQLAELAEEAEDDEAAAVLHEALDTAGFRRGLAAFDLNFEDE